MRLWRSMALLLILLLAACGSEASNSSTASQSTVENGKSIVVYKSPT